MNWNHRVVRVKDNISDDCNPYRYEFKEVFYDDNGNKTGYANAFMWSEDIEGMQELAERLLKATKQPVLDETDFPDDDAIHNKNMEAIVHLAALKRMGYAVVAFEKEELKGHDAYEMEEKLIAWFEQEVATGQGV